MLWLLQAVLQAPCWPVGTLFGHTVWTYHTPNRRVDLSLHRTKGFWALILARAAWDAWTDASGLEVFVLQPVDWRVLCCSQWTGGFETLLPATCVCNKSAACNKSACKTSMYVDSFPTGDDCKILRTTLLHHPLT
eukprot:365755-Chlamydomonas_euryale.AAC.3